MFGVWMRPFCTIRTPRPPYLFVILSGSLDGIMKAEHSYLSGLKVYSCDKITSWILRDYDADLRTKRWSGEKNRKVVLSYPNKEGMKWVWLKAGNMSQSCSPDKTQSMCWLYAIPPQSLVFSEGYSEMITEDLQETPLCSKFWMIWCAFGVSLLVQAQLILGQERLQG